MTHRRLLPILLLATLLRLWQINESLWLDELHSAWVVAAGPTEIVARAQIGNQSPLYFYLPWATTSLFGMSEWALRLPSLVAGVGLVALTYGLAYRFTRSPIAAVASSMLAALDHNFLFYATEARPYACVQLLAATQLYMFWSLQEASTVRRRVAFVASSVGLFYLHYTAILLVAGEVVYMLTRSWYRHDRADVPEYTFRKFTLDLLCVAALTLPMVAHLFDIGARRNAWASFVNNTSLLLAANWFSLVSYVVVPAIVWLVIGIAKVAFTLRRDEPTTRDAVLLTTANGTKNAPSIGSSRRSVTATYLLACWLGGPLAIVWLATVTKVAPLYLGRYVIGAALAPVLFAGLCVGFWESRRSQTLVAGLIIAYSICFSGMINQLLDDGRLFRDRSENWRDAVKFVNANRVGDSPVFVRSGLLEADRLATDASEALREYCVLPIASIYNIERPSHKIRPLTTSNAGSLTTEDVNRIEERREAWFIINGNSATREFCRKRISESLRKRTDFDVNLQEFQFGDVGVFRVVLSIHEAPVLRQPTSPSSIAPP